MRRVELEAGPAGQEIGRTAVTIGTGADGVDEIAPVADLLAVLVIQPLDGDRYRGDGEALADETGARIVVLSPLPGTIKGTETYLALLAYNVTKLVTALQP